ncbi:unnamed protein product [Adineta ricciae]|uniref:Uncharacterized protein n=1 Tax=Adineta ricciae TaxID=249248 RepID=A0A815AZD5_ADIRI|nr:unnamed protein product [Adineta ricciae]
MLDKRSVIGTNQLEIQRTYLFFSLDDESFSSSVYNQWSSILVKELNEEEQLEHDTIAAIRIDHFLMKYRGIQAVDTTKTKILLIHSLKSHEEHLYEMMMYLLISLTKLSQDVKPVGYRR